MNALRRPAVAVLAVLLHSAGALAESGPINIHLEPALAIPIATGQTGTGFAGALKLDVPVAGPLAVQGQAGIFTLPGTLRRTGVYSTGLGIRARLLDDDGGFRFRPAGSTKGGNWFGNVWVDAAVLLTGSGALNRFGVDVGVGGELSLFEGLQTGPFVKYTNADSLSLISVGLSISLGAAAAAKGPEDLDQDGVLDEKDKCPSQAEDKDGHKDEDGCPDPDNDGDNLVDSRDKCAQEAEDADGFEDEDGCPEKDNDQDGIEDAQDKCPAEAEDKLGDAADGCPERDTDGDKLVGAQDRCPAEAEDADGFEDEDGCPELDNDQDAVPDATDKCPNGAETVNGTEDEDGCPEQDAKAHLVGQKLVLTDPVAFTPKTSKLAPETQPLLQSVAELLKKMPQLEQVLIEVHTAEPTTDPENQKLSEARAKAVADFLVKQGIAKERLVQKGHGKSQPLDGAPKERVVLTIVSK